MLSLHTAKENVTKAKSALAAAKKNKADSATIKALTKAKNAAETVLSDVEKALKASIK